MSSFQNHHGEDLGTSPRAPSVVTTGLLTWHGTSLSTSNTPVFRLPSTFTQRALTLGLKERGSTSKSCPGPTVGYALGGGAAWDR